MKKIILVLATVIGSSAMVYAQSGSGDLRSSAKFVETCPDEYLSYIDKSEGGSGAYCNCPENQISYLDKSEGGPGAICMSEERTNLQNQIVATEEIVDVLALAKESDVSVFLKSGNRTKNVLKNIVSPELTKYSLTRQHCFTTGMGPTQCLGGATLEVEVTSEVQMSNLVKVGKSRVLRIK
jgi:hypothetical protein